MASSVQTKKGLVLSDQANVLTVEGDVDLANVGLLLQRLQRLRDEHQTVIVDLAGVSYMDSAGFGALLRVCREIRHRGGRMLLRQPSDHIRRMLEVTEMLRFFDLEG